MRIWLDPAKLNNYGLTPVDVSECHQGAERPGGFRRARRAAGGRRAAARCHHHRSAPTFRRRSSLATSCCGSSRTGAGAAARCGAHRTSAARTTRRPQIQRASGGRIRRSSWQAAPTRWNCAGGEGHDRRGSRRPSRPGSRSSIRSTPRPSCRHSIKDVMQTLAEAVGLVFLVMLLFLQNVRATLIPTIAVPVVLLGTCGGARSRWLLDQQPDALRHGARDRAAGR